MLFVVFLSCKQSEPASIEHDPIAAVSEEKPHMHEYDINCGIMDSEGIQ